MKDWKGYKMILSAISDSYIHAQGEFCISALLLRDFFGVY